MNKSEKMSEEARDRLSELPDSLIYEIFWLLPMTNVVWTTVLSKRWNNLWKTTPYLNFYSHDPDFVNLALLLWRGFKILKFKIRLMRNYNLKVYSDEYFWVRLVKDIGVEELYFEDMLNRVPHDLYSCSSLKVLSLKGSDHLKIHGNVQWNQLKSLTIKGFSLDPNLINQVVSGSPRLEVLILVLSKSNDNLSIRSRCLKNLYSCSSLVVLSLRNCNLVQLDGNVQWNKLRCLMIEECDIDEHSINEVVCGSPQLEVLIIGLDKSYENLSIRSSSLKTLSITGRIRYDDEPSTELRLWSPNLETLDIVREPFGKYSLINVPSSAHLTLDLGHGYRWFCGDFVEDILMQIFSTIQHVEKLTLSGYCVQVLGVMKDKYSISPLSNLKSLTIFERVAVTPQQILDLLQILPQLKSLVIQSLIPANQYHNSILHGGKNLPESFLLHLRIVEITVTKLDVVIFQFIEILLKHASNLQKMVFRGPRTQQMLLRGIIIPRSSPTAELIFANY